MGALTAWVTGLLAPAGMPELPLPVPFALPGLLLGLIALRRRGFALPALALLACAWSLHDYRNGLATRLSADRAGEEIELTGRVAGLPRRFADGLGFTLHTQQLPGLEGRPASVEVRWYRDAAPVAAGETWRLAVRLDPPRSRVNFAGMDLERHYFTAGISALATVTGPAERLAPARGLSGWRGHRLAQLQALLTGHDGAGLVLALALAARAEMPAAQQELLRRTGTAHLLAVSGLHVGLVGGFTWLLLRWPLSLAGARLGWRRPGLLAAWSGLAAAAGYAALAGFGVATRRALLMIAVPVLLLGARRSVSPWAACLSAAGLVLTLEPRSALGAGFWLSFVAVGVLLFTFAPRRPAPGRVSALLLAQWSMSWAMLPLGLAWFGLAAPLGLAANLLAIPWVSLCTLPLTLAGLSLSAPWPVLAEALLAMAANSADWLLRMLAALPHQSGVLGAGPTPGAVALSLALIGALLLTLPRGLSWRWLGLGLMLPVLWRDADRLDAGALRLELLDVGQGLAVLVQTRDGTLLYDTGPGVPGQWSRVRDVVLPALRNLDVVRPDRILVSHADLDHAGGLAELRQEFPGVAVHANLGRAQRPDERCDERLGWTWGEIDFQVLHPSPWLPYRGNDSSCVVAISTPGVSVLLPGDIGRLVERRLAGLATRGHAVVIAPHHGSRSSSSPDFVAWSRPRAALVSSGWDNRFGFPHAEVVSRYRQTGAMTWSTADCGAIRVTLDSEGGIRAQSARRERPAPWRYPPQPGCP